MLCASIHCYSLLFPRLPQVPDLPVFAAEIGDSSCGKFREREKPLWIANGIAMLRQQRLVAVFE